MKHALLLLAAVPVAIAAAAPQAVQLSSSVMVEKATGPAGREQTTLVPATKVVPGDKLVLQTSYRNTAAQPVTKFVITNPIPAAIMWTGDATPGVTASVDGGRSFAPLPQLTVRRADGAHPAESSDVTHLRWTIASIAPGASGFVRFRGAVR